MLPFAPVLIDRKSLLLCPFVSEKFAHQLESVDLTMFLEMVSRVGRLVDLGFVVSTLLPISYSQNPNPPLFSFREFSAIFGLQIFAALSVDL